MRFFLFYNKNVRKRFISMRCTDLDVLAASDLGEMFLRLERLVRTIISGRRTDDTEAGFNQVSSFGKHQEFTEKRHGHQITV